jgi:glycerophosphoryl diester phosphodiesterase
MPRASAVAASVVAVAVAAFALAGCGSSGSSDSSAAPASTGAPTATPPPNAPPPAAVPPPAPGDAGPGDAAPDPTKTYRNSLSVCWTDATCNRAMIVAHGGDWSATGAPYGSMSAVAAAYANGADAVKIDVRVTKDDVPVVAHSSPFQIYESLDCYNKSIEDMTAAEVTACHFVPSTTETFQRLDTMLNYARGKMVVQLTVKKSTDYARTIQEVLALGAQDFAFLEISTSDLQTLIPSITGSNQVYYLINVGTNLAEVDLLLGTIKSPRAFMVEMDASPTAGALTASKLHPAGVRSFTYDSGGAASVAELKGLFDEGFDVVSSNVTANNLQARVAVNGARGVTPP